MASTVVGFSAWRWVSWRLRVCGVRRTKPVFRLVFCFGVLLYTVIPLLYIFLSHFRRWLRNSASLSLYDGTLAPGALPSCTSYVIFALAASGKNKTAEPQQAPPGPKHDDEKEEQKKNEEKPPIPLQPTERPHDARAAILQERSHSRYEDAPDSPSRDFPGGRSPSELFQGNPLPSRCPPSSQTARGRRSLRRSESTSYPACVAAPRLNHLPLLNAIPMEDANICPAQPPEDQNADEVEDAFHMASVDELALSGISTNCLRSRRRRPSVTDTAESRSATKDAVRPTRFRSFRKERPGEQQPARSESPPAERVDTDGCVEIDGRSTLPASEPVTVPRSASEFFADVPDGGFCEIDGFQSAAPDDTETEEEEDLEDVDSEPEEYSIEDMIYYESTKEEYNEDAHKYYVATNAFYTRKVLTADPNLTACAKKNVEFLVDQSASPTSLIQSDALVQVLQFVVRVIWRGAELVVACYPSYPYKVGRSGHTINRLPYFATIFHETLTAQLHDENYGEDVRVKRRDEAFKIQMAAAQAEAALGVVHSVIRSGLTAKPLPLKNLKDTDDLVVDGFQLPTQTGRAFLLMAELCRSLYEMTEPAGQTVLCQTQAESDDTSAEVNPAVAESVDYCKSQAQKLASTFYEVQVAWKKVAERALTLHEKLNLLEPLMELSKPDEREIKHHSKKKHGSRRRSGSSRQGQKADDKKP